LNNDLQTQPFLTQPVQGQVTEWTWSSAMQETRKFAGWLKAQDWPPGSNIVILSRNCAWWIMADFGDYSTPNTAC
jgi:long-chain acyl-CoA synthetase